MLDATQLHKGDEVYWSDPNGELSRYIIINEIEIVDATVIITDDTGFRFECYEDELS